MRNRKSIRVLATALLAAVGASGCSYLKEQKAEQQVEPRLIAAGFKMKLADTPKRLAHLNSMPQLKVQPLNKDGKLLYVYADKKGCNCIYVGDAKAFREYEQEVLDAADANPAGRTSAEERDANVMDYDVDTWDPWEFGEW